MGYSCRYSSPLGGITLSSDGEALTGLWFDGQKRDKPRGEEKALPIFEQTARWLDIYFGGNAPDFTPALKLEGTPFSKEVWEILLSIPYGKTMTYGEIASIIADRNGLSIISAQAVGGAVGSNPIAVIVPCHRVVGARGNLVGYAGGLAKKMELLILEKADISSVKRGV